MKPVKRNNAITILVIVLVLAGCTGRSIPEDTLVKVYVENVIINETYGLKADSVRVHKKALFEKYGVTEKAFLKEMDKYSLDKETWDRFFKKANDYLNDLKKSGAVK